MRRLIITRGPQGAGKSTLIRDLGLAGHALCPDTIRRTLAGAVMRRDGAMTTAHDQEGRVWGMFRGLLDERMSRGEVVVVDATHRARRDLQPYLELAATHRYTLACADLSPIPLELALERNRRRADFEVVPDEVVERTWRACRAGEVPEAILRVPWDPSGAHVEALRGWLEPEWIDGDAWRAVVTIGDLQGCFTPLRRWLDDHPWDPETLYLFVGDLFDRGPENGEIARFMLEILDRPNVRLLWGNHEDHLHRWARGWEPRSREFVERTLPQLRAAGLTPEDADRICERLSDALVYTRGGQRVLVTHGGLPTAPEQLARISTRQYSLGVGFYSDPVDARFSEQAPPGWIQIHGHRNAEMLPIRAASRSYNLEGQVEHGGALRLVVHAAQISPVEIRNARYRPLSDRLRSEIVHDDPPLPPWSGPELDPDPRLPSEDLARLRAHPLVQEKPAASRPWISAFNFTRDAFYQREWDDLNVTARGLFIDTERGVIAARSYDKFFNVGERPETRPEALRANLRFPVTLWLKENGYLGILGYDAGRDDLLFASKSTPDSEFAQWFEEIFDASVPPGRREWLRRLLRDTGSSLAFEVIDPTRDPHIIAYDAPQVVLLDMIRRARDFERAPYETLKRLAQRLGLPVKQRAMRFEEPSGLLRWMEEADRPGWRFQGRYVEGFVLEDSAGFLTKLKLDHYNHWKRMRSLKQRVLAVRRSGKPLGRDVSEPRTRAFYEWLLGQPDAVLEQDILTVQRAFESGAPAALPPPPEAPEGPSEAAIGFARALEGLSRAPTIKRATADRLLAAAMADRDKMQVLRGSATRDRLVLAATPGAERQAIAAEAGMDIDDVEAGGGG